MTATSAKETYGDPATRVRILEAALALVEARGQRVSLNDISREAGVSRQALYLHFGDRAGLMVALVAFVDARGGGLDKRMFVMAADRGVESLRRWIETLSTYHQRIDRLSQVFECGQFVDDALAAAWRDRMGRRRALMGVIVERMAEQGDLDEAWSVDEAADLVFVVTMPGPWRELTSQRGWQPETYAARVFALLTRSLLPSPPRPGAEG